MKNSLYLRAEELKNIYISVSADTVILPGTVVWHHPQWLLWVGVSFGNFIFINIMMLKGYNKY